MIEDPRTPGDYTPDRLDYRNPACVVLWITYAFAGTGYVIKWQWPVVEWITTRRIATASRL